MLAALKSVGVGQQGKGTNGVAEGQRSRLLEGCVGGGDLTREACVFDDQVAVDATRLAVRALMKVGEHERGDTLATDPIARCRGDRLLDQRRNVEALGRGASDEERVAAELPMGLGDPG